MKAAQEEASPAALCRKAPEAQDLLLAERKGVLRRHLSEAPDAASVSLCDGRAMVVTMNTASKLGPHTQTDRGTCPGVGL